ncbi:MAG TPA: AmmeMemoRadiSam system protein B [Candidatus Brocadiia bacterium]|nr:AmmeMemoRadiSam system protein B [Candidatus Brocadiales bacterium]
MINIVVYLLSLSFLAMPVLAQPQKSVREPAVAGSFYSADESTLREQIESFFSKVPESASGGNDKPIALISPHAGYRYSGLVTAYGYNTIKNKNYKRVIVLAPSHYGSFKGVSILRVTHYRTPLGLVEVDKDVCDKLLENTLLFSTYPDADKYEHSLETQLPFLQMTLKDFRLVPLLIGYLSGEDVQKVAECIKSFITNETILIASCDFTHYGYNFDYVPFKKDTEANIKKLDYGAFDRILAFDSDGFLKYKTETGITACGYLPVAVLLKLLPVNAKGTLLNYDTSGRQTGGFTNSVSYASIVFTIPSKEETRSPPNPNKTGEEMDEQAKKNLLYIARKTVEAAINNTPIPEFNITDEALQGKQGAFVTLRNHGQLRGCIGRFVSDIPLYKVVSEMALASATQDPRFQFDPITASELKDIDIEISILSPLEKTNDPLNIELGKHGIYIKRGFRSGCFLPQVATETGWSKEEFLSQCCCGKAGLPPDAWKDPKTDVFVFTAEIVEEKKSKEL